MVPYLRAANIKDDALDLSDVKLMNFTPTEQWIFSLAHGDTLISEGSGSLATVGASAVWRGEIDGTVCFQNTLIRVRPRNNSINGRFLQWWARAAFASGTFASIAGGANINHLGADRVPALPIHFPALDDQQRIADFLDAETKRIGALTAIRAKTLKQLEERVDASRCDCVSGRVLPGPKRAVFPIGEVLASWDIVPLKRVVPRIGVGVVVNPSSYFVEDGVPFVHGNNVRDGRFDLTRVKRISPNDSNALWRSRLSEGDVVVVRAGYPGRAAVVSRDLAGANCASVLIVKRGFRVLPEFIEAFFNSSLGQAQVNIVRYGAAQEQINVGHVVNFLIPAPPLDDQEAQLALLKKQLGDVTRLQAGIRKQIDLLAERRQTLITAAVSGQFDVSSASGRSLM